MLNGSVAKFNCNLNQASSQICNLDSVLTEPQNRKYKSELKTLLTEKFQIIGQ